MTTEPDDTPGTPGDPGAPGTSGTLGSTGTSDTSDTSGIIGTTGSSATTDTAAGTTGATATAGVTGATATRATGPTAIGAAARSSSLFRDTWLVFVRQFRPLLHRPAFLLFGMLQPVLYLVLFAPLLTGLAGAQGQNPWQWFVPGLLVMLGLFTAGFAGFGLLPEIASGAHERLMATPASRVALLLGRVLRDVAVMAMQMVLIVVLVAPFGFRVPLLGFVVGLLLLVVLGIGLSSLSYLVALKVQQTYVFAPIVQTAVMPLMLLSGVLLPMDLAPGWLYALSRANPIAYVVDAERALFAGEWTATVGIGWAVALATTLLVLGLGSRAMRRIAA